MTYDEIVHSIQDKSGFTLAQSRIAFDSVIESLKDIARNRDSIMIKGFGTFGAIVQKRHKGRDFATGETIWVEDRYIPYFKSSEMFKEEVKGV